MVMTHASVSRSCGPHRPVSLVRQRWTRELFLICHFELGLRMQWRLLIDPLGTVEQMIDIGGGLHSQRGHAVLAEDHAPPLAGEGPGPPPNPA